MIIIMFDGEDRGDDIDNYAYRLQVIILDTVCSKFAHNLPVFILCAILFVKCYLFFFFFSLHVMF